MKRFLALICMITCIFGLTACGSEEVLTEYEQWKLENAEYIATDGVVQTLNSMVVDGTAEGYDQYTMEEIEYIVASSFGFNTDGHAFVTALESFKSAAESVGMIKEITDVTSKIDGDQIVVEVSLSGTGKDSVAEVIFSNDMFFKLESAALNPVSTMGELMTNAALNTLIGMGTVFVVLILISFIISCFGIIPKLQKNAAEKKAAKAAGGERPVVENVVRPTVQEEASGDDDQELVAVIAAAIAAFEGSVSTDGFVVRSIRRR